ncbi:MAG: hypothetical protein AB9888_14090 [Bacteroidales bacterium]
MRRIFIVILSMIPMIVIISHDIIHHHHVELGYPETMTGMPADHHETGDDTEDQHGTHFPLHSHVISEDDFLVQRNAFALNNAPKEISIDLTSGLNRRSEPASDSKPAGLKQILKEPPGPIRLYFPCNNITRGSPSIS